MANENEFFCDKNIRPWLIATIALGVLTVIWATANNEEIFGKLRKDKDQMLAQQKTMDFNSPFPPSPQVQLVAQQSPINPNNMMLSGITRATPGGGFQLVRATAPTGFQNVFKNAIRAVEPAVVDIHAICLTKGTPQRGGKKNTPAFLKPFTGNVDRWIGRRPYENIGAGFIIDARGYLVTNYHVVENAASIIVTTAVPNSRDYKAEIIMTDPALDVALLKIISNETFPVCAIGSSGQVTTGDWVIAIGSPFGLDMSVTAGIISGVRKSIKIGNQVYDNLLQTDTPINKGNSGGPLINLNGEVIGVTTAIYAPTGVFSGTGFALPIDSLKGFLRAALGPDPAAMAQVAFGKTSPIRTAPHLGIEVVPVNGVIAREFRLPVTRGLLINRISPNSLAENAGLLRGDTITSMNNVSVVKAQQVSNILQSAISRGLKSIEVIYYRNGTESECTIFLR